ncbi:Ig-like domain (group 3) [Cognatiyoonia koreensis]|uniref:Ig-like domain (Group 3) n=1 Tax=Cognatiyoonia koreensis TaxID=364200 RepID=A0A1I0NHT5_9RHOB|nr:Ig-like domain-containing protein [Cognatiyoonia koreensis]SEW00935.1 Ig-like domain (group 3) [Cognatiyoonia koreensis]
MSAINFVVRGDAGVVERGAVGASGSDSIVVGAGQDISLNLQRNSVLSYTRNGQALQITLVDGQTITLQGFFSPDGVAENKLFLSASGQLAEVQLVAGEGNLLYGQYVDADAFGKWSPDDALYFTDDGGIAIAGVEPSGPDAGMLGVPLLGGLGGLGSTAAIGAAGLGGALLLSGGSEGGEGGAVSPGGEDPDPVDPDPVDPDPVDPDPIDPPEVAITDGVKSVGHTVNDEDHSDGVEISGTGTPGATGTITVGDVTKDVVIGEDGTWTVSLTTEEVEGGEYETGVSITVTNEGGSTTATDTLVIDTITTVTIDTSAAGGDGTVNEVEHVDGVTVNGLAEANATVVVTTSGGATQTVMATSEGTWTATFASSEVAEGTYDLGVTAVSTDAFGNTATASGSVHVDTELDVTINYRNVEGDGVVNAVEQSDGVDITGTTEAGASVVVTFGTGTRTVTADGSGNWSASFTASEVPTGELEAPVTATATDAAGNVATTTRDITIDTEIDVTLEETGGGVDGVINAVERGDGVLLSGETDPNAMVEVTFQGITRETQADSDGNWAVGYTGGELPTGNIETDLPVAVVATDEAGNVATTSGTVTLDTYVNRLASTSSPIEGDDVVNNAEASDGITLTGVVEKGSTVKATFEGVTKAATVTSDGTWTVTFDANEIPSGTYDAVVKIDATDAAGNKASINETFAVDTDAPDAADVTGFIEVQNDTAGAIIRASSDVISGENDVTIHQVGEGAAGGAKEIAATGGQVGGNIYYGFDDEYVVPNGSHLVVQKEDDAGNTNSTLMVLDVNGNDNVDITAGALDGFNIGAIDLEHAEDSVVDLSTADLEAMSANDNILVIHGRDTDTVNLDGAAAKTGTETINGKDYDVYSVGDDGGQLIINSDIMFNQNVV